MNTVYSTNDSTLEPKHNHRHLICWKSTFAGFALAMMILGGALSLAIAFGGIGLSDGSTVQNAGIFAGISVLVATVLAIFTGSYFSVRLARFKVDVVGCSQGLVLGSLVVVLVLWQTAAAVGMIGKAAAQATGAAAVAAGATAGAAAQNPVVQDMIEDNLGGAKLQSDTSVVVRGVTSRLMRGDQEGAKNYLAAQAGMTPEEANTRIAAMKAKADELMVKAREVSATTLKTTGWSIFLLIALSAIASVLGGLLASQVNLRGTLDAHNEIMAPASRRQSVNTLDNQPART